MTQLYSPIYGINSKAGIKITKLEEGKTRMVIKDQREQYLATDSAPITSLVIKIQKHCMHSSRLYTSSFFPLQINS